jgi:oxazoline/thiazoline dehydrogenase
VKLRDDVMVERPGKRRITLFGNGLKFLDSLACPLIECLIEDWMTEASIDVLAESTVNPPAIYFMCEKLFSLNLLQLQCMVDGQPLFSLLPAPDWFALQGSVPTSLRRLSPSACLRRDVHYFLLEMPLSQRKCIIRDEKCLSWLMEIARGGLSLPVMDAARMAFYRALWLMGALEQDEQTHPPWEFHDLIFFHHSSIGFHDDPIGATRRLKDKLLPAPLFKPCVGECVSLPEPDGQLMEKLRTPFAEVLANRRSNRIPGNRPITIEELGALLRLSASVQTILDDPSRPCPVSLRPSPSGGALHSLEIYPLVRQCTGLTPGALALRSGTASTGVHCRGRCITRCLPEEQSPSPDRRRGTASHPFSDNLANFS